MPSLTVADIMDPDIPTVAPEDTLESVLRLMREHELSGVPVVNTGGRCVGIITEADLIMTGEDADLHLPHYFELFGGLVILPKSLEHFEERLRKATAALARDLMTEDPDTIEAEARRARRRAPDLALQAQPDPGRASTAASSAWSRGSTCSRRSPTIDDAAGAGPDQPRRDRAQLRHARRAWPRPPACARWSRPTATGTARCPRRAPRWPAGPRWLAVATAGEAAALRAAGLTAPLLVMGALSDEELDVALAAGADVVAWREGFVRDARRPSPRRGHGRPRQARHGHGPARARATPPRRRARRPPWPPRRACASRAR